MANLQETLTNHHALVCGASRGIGKATAFALAEAGASITLLARNGKELEKIRNQLPRRANQKHCVVVADLQRSEELPDRLITLARPVHILVNNAGGPPGGILMHAEAEEFRHAFERLLISPHRLAQMLVPDMRAAEYGRIINVVSTSVREPIAGLGVSNTIRAAVAGWAKTLSREVAREGITVNNILPGFTRTERLEQLFSDRSEKEQLSLKEVEQNALKMIPAGRFGTPEDIAAAIRFLASTAAGYITGTSLAVDGGRLHSI